MGLTSTVAAGVGLSAACGGTSVVVAPMAGVEPDGGADGGDAAVDAAADGRRVASRPLPPEPTAPPRRNCRREVSCREEELEVPAVAFPAPFDRCPPTFAKSGGGGLSVKETRTARADDPHTCCYVEFKDCGPVSVPPVIGRPPRDHDGNVTSGASTPRADWIAPGLAVAAPAASREVLARHWAAVGALEHASVASFARLSLELLALGAPPELVAKAHEAALDEIEHARLAFAVASSHGGAPVGPAPLRVGAGDAGPVDARRVFRETFGDGCVGETLAALEARAAAREAADPAVRAALERIADDEERHAELAWRVVAWLLSAGLVDASEIEVVTVDLPSEPQALDDAAAGSELARHGVLSDRARAECRAAAVHEVVQPCLDALRASARRGATELRPRAPL